MSGVTYSEWLLLWIPEPGGVASNVLPTMFHQLNPVGTGYGLGRHFGLLKIYRLHLFNPR